MSKEIAAVFDIDGTLLRGSSEEYLIKYLIEIKKIPFLSTLKILKWFFLHKLGLEGDGLEIRRYAASLIGGWDIKETRRIINEHFQKSLAKRIHPEAFRMVQSHKKKGHLIVLNTASFDIVAYNYIKLFGADYLIATKLEAKDGKLTGKIDGPINFSKNKALIFNDFANKHGLDLENSYCYTNNVTDLGLIAMFGNKVVVNPERRLRRIAKSNNWPIITLSEH